MLRRLGPHLNSWHLCPSSTNRRIGKYVVKVPRRTGRSLRPDYRVLRQGRHIDRSMRLWWRGSSHR
ncbi:hypothetical protein B0H10DRAFT_63921 [Mycena sp. CBHHK59/15]|nr:hypothetical protein B0H10DRAFT_63921 [Mycena sp. CBHHK59/15]